MSTTTAAPPEGPAPAPEIGAELTLREGGERSLQVLAGATPELVLAHAAAIAGPLKDLVEQQKLDVDMGGGRKHVEVGAWQALGHLLGALGGKPVTAHTVWIKPFTLPDGTTPRTSYHVKETRKKWGGPKGQRVVENESVFEYDVDGYDWQALVEIRTPDGDVVGAAQGMCSRTEHTWATRSDTNLSAMAETRATSRAFRAALGWIMHLAGYNATPAEEMSRDGEREAAPPAAPASQHPYGPPASEKQIESTKGAIAYVLEGIEADDPRVAELLAKLEADTVYLSNAVMRALAFLARALREQTQATIEAGDAPPPEAQVVSQAQADLDAEAAAAAERGQ